MHMYVDSYLWSHPNLIIRAPKPKQDIEYMIQALKTLGIALKETAPKQWTVPGRGAPFDTNKPLQLFLGNAGTAMRPLTAALCAGKGQVRRWDPPTMKPLSHNPSVHYVGSLPSSS